MGNIKRLHSSIILNHDKNNELNKKDQDLLYQSITQHTRQQQQQGNNKIYNIKKEVTLHQYEKLKTLLLPTSSQYILWLLYSNPISFFQDAKELAIKQNNLMNSTRISSKQIGEKCIKTTQELQHQQNQEDNTYECENNNFKLFWPYFCNELSISVDQEERIVSLYKIIQKSIEKSSLERINKTQHVVSYLKRIMLQKLQQQKQQQLQNNINTILTKEQYVTYLKWRIDNKLKCNDIIQKILKKQVMDKGSVEESHSPSISSFVENQQKENEVDDNRSLDELCRRLNEALAVSATSSNTDEAVNMHV